MTAHRSGLIDVERARGVAVEEDRGTDLRRCEPQGETRVGQTVDDGRRRPGRPAVMGARDRDRVTVNLNVCRLHVVDGQRPTRAAERHPDVRPCPAAIRCPVQPGARGHPTDLVGDEADLLDVDIAEHVLVDGDRDPGRRERSAGVRCRAGWCAGGRCGRRAGRQCRRRTGRWRASDQLPRVRRRGRLADAPDERDRQRAAYGDHENHCGHGPSADGRSGIAAQHRPRTTSDHRCLGDPRADARGEVGIGPGRDDVGKGRPDLALEVGRHDRCSWSPSYA